MRFQPLSIFTAAVFFAIGCCSGFALSAGADRKAVIEELGKPASAVRLGNREILTYPKKVRIELVDGKVERVEGVQLDDAVPPPPAPIEPVVAPKPAATVTSAPKSPVPAKAPAPPPKKSQEEIEEEAAEKSFADHLEGKDRPNPSQHEDRDGFSPQRFLTLGIVLAVHFALTCALLKLAFKVWELDAFLTGFLAIAGLDVAIRLFLELLGGLTGGITQAPSIQSGICAGVMIFTIRRFCFNKDWFAAVRAAMIVKLGGYLFWLLAGTILMRLLLR